MFTTSRRSFTSFVIGSISLPIGTDTSVRSGGTAGSLIWSVVTIRPPGFTRPTSSFAVSGFITTVMSAARPRPM